MAQAQAQQQGLDITTLPVQQLSQLQQRISQELEHLSNSHARLRAAQARFKDCIRSIKDGVEGKKSGMFQGPPKSTLQPPRLLNIFSCCKDLKFTSNDTRHLKAPIPSHMQASRYVRLTLLETPLLIPLTTSLYVPARPNDSKSDKVLVDVGTGFFVEKKTPDAIKFYSGKVEDLNKNLGDIEKAVGSKNGDLRMVEDVLRGKVLAEQSGKKKKNDGD